MQCNLLLNHNTPYFAPVMLENNQMIMLENFIGKLVLRIMVYLQTYSRLVEHICLMKHVFACTVPEPLPVGFRNFSISLTDKDLASSLASFNSWITEIGLFIP